MLFFCRVKHKEQVDTMSHDANLIFTNNRTYNLHCCAWTTLEEILFFKVFKLNITFLSLSVTYGDLTHITELVKIFPRTIWKTVSNCVWRKRFSSYSYALFAQTNESFWYFHVEWRCTVRVTVDNPRSSAYVVFILQCLSTLFSKCRLDDSSHEKLVSRLTHRCRWLTIQNVVTYVQCRSLPFKFLSTSTFFICNGLHVICQLYYNNMKYWFCILISNFHWCCLVSICGHFV